MGQVAVVRLVLTAPPWRPARDNRRVNSSAGPAGDRPQIGPLDVDRNLVEAAGEPLTALLERLKITLTDEPVDAPTDGWRILRKWEGGALALGAPSDGAGSSWRVAHVGAQTDGSGRRSTSIHPDEQPLRPSRATRARGLALRWPTVSTAEAERGVYVIDILNVGDVRWRPDGDPFHVVGVITPPGQDDIAFGYAEAAGRDHAVPLEPGEYARVRVAVSAPRGDDLRPGDHVLHAVLVPLGVRAASPLPLELTPERLDGLRTRSAPRRGGGLDRQYLEHERRRRRDLVAARPRLGEIAELVAAASTGSEALGYVQQVLGIDERAARTILYSSLFDFTDEALDRLAQRGAGRG